MKQQGKSFRCFPDEKATETVKAILKSGGDVEIRRRGDGYVILEVTKKIKYCT